jgi:hypothetical protein
VTEGRGFWDQWLESGKVCSGAWNGAAHDEDKTEDRRGLKAKIAREALRERATINDLAQRYQVRPNQIYECDRARLNLGWVSSSRIPSDPFTCGIEGIDVRAEWS